ncbi:MAG: DUF3685 domain-containing protein [Roseofilum sp. SBFL]|uniref:DUF3685 domain-containing protein n=1 Tax=unclassified Roseofilum TaxID=2620099 RepID=UPI001B1EFA79|nr:MULTISPECIES: DUF3685 domain-containing protein [unclassified Roseofilum]MBP0039827.1 DUF3685 domain-containing protein [Roseofilum sp. SID1]MBP0044400.1 DUF3685 domain-containing protein [Roseofilum sp. SBFL]
MSNSQPSSISLLLIVPSRIFRLGLQVALKSYPEITVMAEVETPNEALTYLQAQRLSMSDRPGVGIIAIDTALETSLTQNALLRFCQTLKTSYPHYRLVLLTDPGTVSWQRTRAVGVDGYCPKTADRSQLVAMLKQVAMGESYQVSVDPSSSKGDRPSWWTRVKHRWYLWGIKTISDVEAKLKAQLNQPGLSVLERIVIRGRLRELFTARWCIHWLLAPRLEAVEFQETTDNNGDRPNSGIYPNQSLVPAQSSSLDPEWSDSLIPISPRQQVLETTATHLQFQLNNLTHTPLELDILKPQKRQELLQVILEEWEVLLEDLRFSQIQGDRLLSKKLDFLRDLWSAVVTQFFGKYSRIIVKGAEVEIVPILLQDIDRIQAEYLEKVPLFVDLLNYLVYEIPLMIDNRLYAAGTPEAQKRAEMLTQNLIVQLGNSVVNPLLNHFADVVAVKQIFYDQELITSRKIERFRNDLSWKSRQQQWFGEPKAIFESQYSLLVLEARGIQKVCIYAPRREELDQLNGWSLGVTLILEGRDAIAPRLQALVGSVGQVLIYILTHIIGRGIGLVARGVLQGIGNSWSDSRLSGNGDRPK